MANIHAFPVRGDRSGIDHTTAMLTDALAQGVDLGPRGHHIQAIAFKLEQQVEGLRQLINEFQNNPVRTMIGLDQLEVDLSRLSENIAKIAAMAENASE